jgi:hypothetical protein
VDLLTQDFHELVVRNGVEILSQISLNKPTGTGPCALDSMQGCVTATARSEAMGVITKLWFVIGFQNATDDFLKQLIAPACDS